MESFFSKKNYLGVLLGAVLLGIGFYFVSLTPADNKLALNVAPFILVISYAIVIPLSLMLGKKKIKEE
jgi:hypothetical protein